MDVHFEMFAVAVVWRMDSRRLDRLQGGQPRGQHSIQQEMRGADPGGGEVDTFGRGTKCREQNWKHLGEQCGLCDLFTSNS